MDDLDDMLHKVEQGDVSPDDASKKIHGDKAKRTYSAVEGTINVTVDGDDETFKGEKCCWGSDNGKWHVNMTKEKKPYLSSLFFGIYLILQSVAIVLYNLNLLPAAGSWWNIVWPVILFCMGLKMIVSEAVKGKFAIIGTAICAIGIGRMLVNSAMITMSTWWSWFWPIILIVAGIAMLIRALMGKTDWEVHFD
ncbi:MAG: hypothetical protein KA140_02065 [Caldisericia bacterium]|nr:hypothetical protein [Caldisericia bacterium]